MTEVMNYFQAMFMFKNVTAVAVSRQEVELAKDLKAEAQELARIADEEMKNGRAARELALNSTAVEKSRAFAEIAVWHMNRAAEKYRKAAARFEEAGKVYTKKSQAFYAKAEEMSVCAAEAEAEV